MSLFYGRTDVPVEDKGADKLNMKNYAEGLVEFVMQTETPMTIGIQGSWGSGKTSLMKMIQEALKKKYEDEVLLNWFETWQYGAVGDADVLGVRLLEDLVNTLQQDVIKVAGGYNMMLKLRRSISLMGQTVGKAAAAGAVSHATGGFIDGGTAVEGLFPSEKAVTIGDIRTSFQEVVDVAVGVGDKKKAQRRIVVFVDDLDRIRPGRAVGLLEILKNFMDVEHCVFVVACDYAVVREGVRELMGIKDPKKVDAFFHKIFQVPFHMPESSYGIKDMLMEFLRDRLDEGGAAKDGEKPGPRKKRLKKDADVLSGRYAPLIEKALGTNPRAFKRFLNVIDLQRCVDAAWTTKGKPLASWNYVSELDKGRTRRWLASLLGIVAFQQRWPKIAAYLFNTQACDSPEAFTSTMRTLAGMYSEEEQDTEADEEVIFRLRSTYPPGPDGNIWEHAEVSDLRDYCKLWFIQLDAQDNPAGVLDAKELNVVQAWSRRMGSMGSTAVKRTGWYGFRMNAKKNSPKAGDGWAGALLTLKERCESRHFLETSADKSLFVLVVRRPGGKKERLATFGCEEKLQLLVNVGIDKTANWNLPEVADAGARFSEKLRGLGIEPQAVGGPSGRFKAHFGPDHTATRGEAFSKALNQFVDEVDKIARDAEMKRIADSRESGTKEPADSPDAPKKDEAPSIQPSNESM